jgi:hypothetical protein
VALTALIVAASFKPADAQEVNAGGLGVLSCYTVMERIIRNVSYVETVGEWVTGFITGANGLYISADKKYKDPTALLAGGNYHIVKSVIAGCRANPTQPVVVVVEKMYWALPSKDWP